MATTANERWRWEPAGFWRSVGAAALLFFLANVFLFAVWRGAFLLTYTSGGQTGSTWRVLLSGFRLDMALLGMEAALVVAVCVLTLSVRTRFLFVLLCGFSALNLLASFADFQFYGLRNQHMGELVVANLTDFPVVYSEVRAFVVSNPGAAAGLVAGLLLMLFLVIRIRRAIPALRWSLLRPVRLVLLVLAGAVLFNLVREPVTSKKEKGFSVEWASSCHYALLSDYQLNQAVANPLLEILVVHLPRLFIDEPEPRLDPEEAAAVCRARLPGVPGDPKYPLLTTIRSDLDLGIENVFVILVEGLSASVVEAEEGGRPVTPFLRDLMRDSISYPNGIQNFNNTAGGVYCAVTSLPRTCLEEPRPRIFTQREIDGRFGSLPRLLTDPGRRSFFFAGYRQSHFQYTAFAGNQGFKALAYPDFHRRLEGLGREEQDENLLGVLDGPFLRMCAETLIEADAPFVAYAMTASTHAPWNVPEEHAGLFKDERLVAYHYLDAALRGCFETFRQAPEVFAKTLFVIMADHTSPTFKPGWIEGLRIPIVFYGEGLAAAGLAGVRKERACQVDVVPTVLALMGGERTYAGLGRNLLDPARAEGVLSGTRNEAFYLKGDYVLRWRYLPEELALLSIEGGEIGTKDLSTELPALFAAMRLEMFAQYETAARLARDRGVLPED